MAQEIDDDAILHQYLLPGEATHPAKIAERLLREPEHRLIKECEVPILWLMRSAPQIKGGMVVLGTVHEPTVQGRLRDLFEQMLVHTFGFMPRFIITLSAEFWRDATALQREALVWHELSHIRQAVDKHGEPRFDRETGEPVLTLVEHDVAEFVSTVERYGAWNEGLRHFVEVVR